MAVNYYGWGIGGSGYDGVIKIDENFNAYYYDCLTRKWVHDDTYLKAKWDPSCDFEEITEEEASQLIKKLTKKSH